MSSPPLRVFLNSSEDKTLFELRKAGNVPQITKDRAQVIRLSSQGWKVSKIASYFGWSVQTVRSTIHRWKKRGLVGLGDAPRSGRTRKWKPEDLEKLEESLEKEQRTYSSQPCQAAKAQQVIWERLGLYIFFLPKYCSEMNRIETEWLRLKADELAGQMFEDEYDLALAVIEGIEARSQLAGCTAQRYRFNLSSS